MSFGQRIAIVRQLTPTIEQRIAEGLYRGLPAVVRSADPLPGALDPMAPIKPHGVLAIATFVLVTLTAIGAS